MTVGGEASSRRYSPKRERVRRHVIRLLEDTVPGFVVAAERDLAAELGVSRPTVRAVIEELAEEGVVIRRLGRGTFVGSNLDAAEAPVAAPSAVHEIGEAGWSSRVLAFTRPFATPSRTARLELEDRAPVLNVVRILRQGDAPVAIEHLALPEGLLPGLVPADLAVPDLSPLLRERFGIVVRTVRETAESGLAEPSQAELLDVEVGAPVLRVERRSRDTRGRVVALSETVYRDRSAPVDVDRRPG
ncbi:hypothetical protein SD37_10070 [Amycolatopsis orientalis]|uniref:HTH gntR-type domain-containing protein n=1 Tax=Amycolatopsis orientalis TaxID=31958 RepID=A0A193BUQ8_AMYOR|nr:hypothetical protein SD37_10070 [Amycolatopsis orientalis]